MHDQPERDDAASSDQMAEHLLRVYGVPADEAEEICRRPLPDLDALARAAPVQETSWSTTDAARDNSRDVSARL